MRSVGQDQPLGTRGAEGVHGLLDREMTARLTVQFAAFERGLAQEEIASAGELGEPLAGPGVARVGERAGAVR